jgi:hypothetical protein
MIWEENITHTGEIRNAYKILVGKPERNRPLADVCIDERIKLKWIRGKYGLTI